MIGWLQLTDGQRRTSLAQASAISGITEKAIEKDLWVTLTLKALFGTVYAKHLIFKGGTSLSKGWKLIERFSEDIDIALEPEAFGRDYKKDPSHTYVKTLKKEGCLFTSTILKEALEKQFGVLGIPVGMIIVVAAEVPVTIPDRDPQTLFIQYPSLYPPNPYLADEVKVEFSVRSLKEPFADVAIQSILWEVFPNKLYEEIPFDVTAVNPRKTLLEKAFLLHEKLLTTTPEKMQGERQSRHLYDLVKMMHTPAGNDALTDIGFYATLPIANFFSSLQKY
ncbi:MAG: nucleotidyl transferase AbiEii/AbiGii toxin family protein [Ferruginibacter sp.]